MSMSSVNFDNVRKAVFIAGEPTTLDGDGFRELVVDFAKDTLKYDDFELADKLMCIDLGVLTGSFGSEVSGDWDIFVDDGENEPVFIDGGGADTHSDGVLSFSQVRGAIVDGQFLDEDGFKDYVLTEIKSSEIANDEELQEDVEVCLEHDMLQNALLDIFKKNATIVTYEYAFVK